MSPAKKKSKAPRRRRSSVSPLTIGGVTVHGGERKRIELPVARLPTGAWTSIALEVIRGPKEGPTCWFSGALHGDEIDGVEIVQEVAGALRPERLRGTVIAVPIVNAFGFVAQSRYMPDRRDLNRAFPGSKRGSLAARLAELFIREVVSHCDFGIDFHCGSDDRVNYPQVRADLSDPETRRLALEFGAPVVLDTKPPGGSLRAAATRANKTVMVFEGGEAKRFTRSAIRMGGQGALRVLEALDMVSDMASAAGAVHECYRSRWVRAARSGICRLDVELGQVVEKGEPLGVVGDAFGDHKSTVKARIDGVVIGQRLNPLVNRGDAIVHIAAQGDPAS
ncbi:MAG: succinylglutamate desuccinylase/aspartoacylase family protein [Longimicrobiales bacterium]